MVFVWNRSTRTGKLYLNGVYTGEQHSTGQDIDLILTNHTTFEIGFKKDTKEILHGSLRDLLAFLRPLTTEEAYTLCSKSRTLYCDCRRVDIKALLAIIVFRIYTLSDHGDSSNVIGSLSGIMTLY